MNRRQSISRPAPRRRNPRVPCGCVIPHRGRPAAWLVVAKTIKPTFSVTLGSAKVAATPRSSSIEPAPVVHRICRPGQIIRAGTRRTANCSSCLVIVVVRPEITLRPGCGPLACRRRWNCGPGAMAAIGAPASSTEGSGLPHDASNSCRISLAVPAPDCPQALGGAAASTSNRLPGQGASSPAGPAEIGGNGWRRGCAAKPARSYPGLSQEGAAGGAQQVSRVAQRGIAVAAASSRALSR